MLSELASWRDSQITACLLAYLTISKQCCFSPRLTHMALWTPLAISSSSLRMSEVWRHMDEYWRHRHSKNAAVSGGLSLTRLLPVATISLTTRPSSSLRYVRVRLRPSADFKKGETLFWDGLLLDPWGSEPSVMQVLHRIISPAWLVAVADVWRPSIQGTAVMLGSGTALFTSFNSKKGKQESQSMSCMYFCMFLQEFRNENLTRLGWPFLATVFGDLYPDGSVPIHQMSWLLRSDRKGLSGL